MFHRLTLESISLNVNLGHVEEERRSLQRVFLQVTLQFASLPTACTTDNLQDTICCASLAQELQTFCDGRSFKLLETLTYQLYQYIKKRKLVKMTSDQISVFLRITKDLSLKNLRQFSFEIGD